MSCSFCHEAHGRKYRFCTNCGIKLSTLFGSEYKTEKQMEEFLCSNDKCKSTVYGMKFCEVCGTFVIANQRLNNNNLLGRVTLWRSISPPSIPQEMQINKEKRSQYEEAIQRRRDALVQHKKAIARIKLSHLSQHEQTTTDPNKRLLLRLSRMDSIARSAFASIV